MTLLDLPAVNAALNTLSTIFLVAGYYWIRQGNQQAHRKAMLAAVVTSVLFLISYLTYHTYISYVLGRGPTIFREPEWFRPIYLVILGTHTILAMVIVPMVLRGLWLAFKGRNEAHKRLSRWTWPLWMYVSVTGVLIYLLLYQVFPQT